MEQNKKRGPQSEQGKAVSSMNALSTGVYSNALLPGWQWWCRWRWG